MPQHTFNLSLTDELTAFIDRQTGPGTTWSTRSEYLRGLIREKMERSEAATMRERIIEGFADASADRVVEYEGDLKSLMNDARSDKGA
ncbi:MAG: type II toxin-antitoxin system ParD family antitoxin [Phycisphaerales bacterium JB052]